MPRVTTAQRADPPPQQTNGLHIKTRLASLETFVFQNLLLKPIVQQERSNSIKRKETAFSVPMDTFVTILMLSLQLISSMTTSALKVIGVPQVRPPRITILAHQALTTLTREPK